MYDIFLNWMGGFEERRGGRHRRAFSMGGICSIYHHYFGLTWGGCGLLLDLCVPRLMISLE